MAVAQRETGESGVTFPLEQGRRASTPTAKGVFADSVRTVDPALAQRIDGEPAWRSGYLGHVRDVLVSSVRTPQAASTVAREGLDSVHRRFVFSGPGGDQPLGEALRAAPARPLSSVMVEGGGDRERVLTVPYAGARLQGDALHRRLDRWVADGVMEPSHAEAVRAVMAAPDWLDLSDHSVALLGAGAEMAPTMSLLRWGATVHAVDVQHAPVWRRMLEAVRGSAGRLVLPVGGPASGDVAEDAGVDLVREPHAVRQWLAGLDRPLVVGNYGYADGAGFARLAVAVDAITDALLVERPDTVAAVLATPTDVFAVPPEAVTASRQRWERRRMRRVAQLPLRGLSGRRLYRPNYPTTVTVPDGRELGVADCLVAQQGPNYALAKELQRWRAVAAVGAGHVVSANVAPPTRTRSVVRNRALAAAYAGAHRFGVEVFAPATSSTLMAALLVHDLRNPPAALAHPHDLFMRGANHGGLWRVAYEPRSVLGLAVLLGWASRS